MSKYLLMATQLKREINKNPRSCT